MAEKVYYCNSCQLGITTCINNNEYIKSDFYQQTYSLLKEIQNFGDKDSNNPRLPNVDNFFTLEIKNLINELITHNFYDDIINTLNNNNNSNQQNQIIYGSYWENLKTKLQNIKISDTKYWEKTCCSCNGYCSSDGWYNPCYSCQSCVQGSGECCSYYNGAGCPTYGGWSPYY